MAKAFLSHSSAQKELVTNIAKRLGLDNCVIDIYHFAAGEPTLEQIFGKIESSDLFVMFLTSEALNSQWVRRELEHVSLSKSNEILPRLLIFNVDSNLSHEDARIPEWIREQYNLKSIKDEILIYKKIDSKLRDISIEKYPRVKAKEEIFIGRNSLMEEFESKYHNLENTKPSCIIVSGMEEVGRRKFLIMR
jgi:hypothetical protein